MCAPSGGSDGTFQNMFMAGRARRIARRNGMPGAAGTPGVIGPSPSYPAPGG